MSAKADRERAERSAAARQRQLTNGLTAIRDAPTLIDAIAHAIALYELTQLAHLPVGGGYATHRRAHPMADFIVHALHDTGRTRT
jgi:hypothetical protein